MVSMSSNCSTVAPTTINLNVKAIKSVSGILEFDTLNVGDAVVLALADTEAELVPDIDGLRDAAPVAVTDPDGDE
jgi:hypothetical protein